MTEHEEKARELVEEYQKILIEEGLFYVVWNRLAKQSALIAVEEIIKELKFYADGLFLDLNDPGGWKDPRFDYWEKVKQAIEKI